LYILYIKEKACNRRSNNKKEKLKKEKLKKEKRPRIYGKI
jgi:hypothetical protein